MKAGYVVAGPQAQPRRRASADWSFGRNGGPPWRLACDLPWGEAAEAPDFKRRIHWTHHRNVGFLILKSDWDDVVVNHPISCVSWAFLWILRWFRTRAVVSYKPICNWLQRRVCPVSLSGDCWVVNHGQSKQTYHLTGDGCRLCVFYIFLLVARF